MIGVSAVVALGLDRALPRTPLRLRLHQRFSWIVAVGLGIAHVLYAPFATSSAIRAWIALAHASEAADRLGAQSVVAGDHRFNVVGIDPEYSPFPTLPMFGSRAPKSVHVLSSIIDAVSIRRIDSSSVELVAAEAPLFPAGSRFSRLRRLCTDWARRSISRA